MVGYGRWEIRWCTPRTPRTTLGGRFLPPRVLTSSLNVHWGTDLVAMDWIHFWKKIWGSSLFLRDKICLWHVLNHGYFHHLQARIWGVHPGTCPCCNSLPESIDHLFFGCRNLRCRWATLAVILAGTSLAPVFSHNSLWEIIRSGVVRAKCSPIPIVLILDMLQCIWSERNAIQYRCNCLQLPIRVLLHQSVNHVKALIDMCNSKKRQRVWTLELQFLELAANPPCNLNSLYVRHPL